MSVDDFAIFLTKRAFAGCFADPIAINSPSSMSGGNPPTKTLREKRSPLSDPCECGEERAGEPSWILLPSMKPPPPDSSVWSSFW